MAFGHYMRCILSVTLLAGRDNRMNRIESCEAGLFCNGRDRPPSAKTAGSPIPPTRKSHPLLSINPLQIFQMHSEQKLASKNGCFVDFYDAERRLFFEPWPSAIICFADYRSVAIRFASLLSLTPASLRVARGTGLQDLRDAVKLDPVHPVILSKILQFSRVHHKNIQRATKVGFFIPALLKCY